MNDETEKTDTAAAAAPDPTDPPWTPQESEAYEKTRGEWTPFTFNVSMTTLRPRSIYVVKIDNGYVRVSAPTGKMIGVRDRRMATRFDSCVWAKTIAVTLDPPGRVVRLVTPSDKKVQATVNGDVAAVRKDTEKEVHRGT